MDNCNTLYLTSRMQVVGPNVVLNPGTRVTVSPPAHARNDSECSTDSEHTHCSDPLDNSSDSDALGADRWGVVYVSADDDSGSEGSDVDSRKMRWYERTALLDDYSDSSDSTPVPSEPEPDSEMGFYGEVCDSFRAGFAIQKKIDNVLIEINASKHAYNVSINDQLMHSTRALLEMCLEIKELPKYVKYFGPMFIKLAKDRDSQMVILNEIETWALEGSKVAEVKNVLLVMYNCDVLDESNILEWAEGASGEVKEAIAVLVKWLNEAEEESSDESD